MAGSKKKNTLGPLVLCHLRDQLVFPERTPGSLGRNDAGDPSRFSLLGDTPGPVGMNDCGVPEKLALPGLNTLHDWARENDAHLPVDMQSGRLYPAGKKDDVLKQAADFLIKKEGIPEYPIVPAKNGVPIAASGITIGVGYDLGQHDERKIRKDWAELDRVSQPYRPSNDALGLPTLQLGKDNVPAPSQGSKLSFGLDPLRFGGDIPPAHPGPTPESLTLDPVWITPLDRLARAATLKKMDALRYLPKVDDIWIPRDLSLRVFTESTLPETYRQVVEFFPGLTELPAGVQVAMLSLVYNRGLGKDKTGKVVEGRVKIPASPAAQGPQFELGSKSKSLLGLKPLSFAGENAALAPSNDSFSFGLEPLRLGPKPPQKPATAGSEAAPAFDDDIFRDRWEQWGLVAAVHDKDLVWIYWYFESSRRIWAYDETKKDLVKRREEELKLILPYVMADLQHEAFLQRFRLR